MSETKHPSAQRRYAQLCERFRKLRKEHEVSVNRMWAGALALTFTDEELTILSDFLCPNDQSLLGRMREPCKSE